MMSDEIAIRFTLLDNDWCVSSPDLPGLATQGKSLEEARERAREALSSLWDDVGRAYAAELIETLEVPSSVLVSSEGQRQAIVGYVKKANVLDRLISTHEYKNKLLEEAAELIGVLVDTGFDLSDSSESYKEKYRNFLTYTWDTTDYSD